MAGRLTSGTLKARMRPLSLRGNGSKRLLNSYLHLCGRILANLRSGNAKSCILLGRYPSRYGTFSQADAGLGGAFGTLPTTSSSLLLAANNFRASYAAGGVSCIYDMLRFTHNPPVILVGVVGHDQHAIILRSEERRVGKECRCRWAR